MHPERGGQGTSRGQLASQRRTRKHDVQSMQRYPYSSRPGRWPTATAVPYLYYGTARTKKNTTCPTASKDALSRQGILCKRATPKRATRLWLGPDLDCPGIQYRTQRHMMNPYESNCRLPYSSHFPTILIPLHLAATHQANGANTPQPTHTSSFTFAAPHPVPHSRALRVASRGNHQPLHIPCLNTQAPGCCMPCEAHRDGTSDKHHQAQHHEKHPYRASTKGKANGPLSLHCSSNSTAVPGSTAPWP